MMRSMFSSVSGLKAHQTRMDVIGNNIANVNTVGYKASRTTFQEIFAQTISSASAPDSQTGRGGTNPMQIGLGMNVDAIDMQMTSGSVQRTESPTDLSIEGEGFFIVRSGTEGSYLFTRAGNFTIDKQGNLVTSSGQNVYGWMKYEYTDDGYVFDTQEPLMALNLYSDVYNSSKRIIAAKATSEAVLAGNLDSTEKPIKGVVTNSGDIYSLPQDAVKADGTAGSDGIPDDGTNNITPHFSVPLTVYDALGNEHKVTLKMWKNAIDDSGTAPVTTWYYYVDPGSNATIDVTDAGNYSGYIKFNAKGKIDTSDTNAPVTKSITIKPKGETGAEAFTFNIDLSQLTMYADDSSVKASRVDGYPPGTLTTFSIGKDGVITGIYDNGRQQPLGQVAIATFENTAGLQKVGSNQFMQTTNSGDFTTGKQPGHDGAGTLVTGTLEMSNVDLAGQFTEMIITQRGFQANSRVITTSDELLQELASLKR